MTESKVLLLIDGNNLFHRAYHALPPLTDKSSENANAVFGFSNMIIKAIGEIKPTYIACAFDTRAPTFRHVEFEAYKAQRVAPPPDLYPQLPKVKSVLDAFGIKFFEKEGYEADDILATIASRVLRLKTKDERLKPKKALDLSPSSLDVIILSGDRDLLQLVDGNIKVQAPGWNLQGTTLYGSVEVEAKFNVRPNQMVDYKALTGDPSDNVPGIAGIGPKTASALLQKYHTLEGILEQLNNDPVSLGNLAGKLGAGRDYALAAKKLIALDTRIDLRVNISDLKYEPNMENVVKEFEELGFKSIVAKLRGKENVSQVSNVSTVNETENDQLELI